MERKIICVLILSLLLLVPIFSQSVIAKVEENEVTLINNEETTFNGYITYNEEALDEITIKLVDCYNRSPLFYEISTDQDGFYSISFTPTYNEQSIAEIRYEIETEDYKEVSEYHDVESSEIKHWANFSLEEKEESKLIQNNKNLIKSILSRMIINDFILRALNQIVDAIKL